MSEDCNNKPPKINWLLLTILAGILLFGFISGFNLQACLNNKVDKEDYITVCKKNEKQDEMINSLMLIAERLATNQKMVMETLDRLSRIREREIK